MNAQEHIQSKLDELAHPVQREALRNSSVEEAILAKVMSKKFRKVKADDQAIANAKQAIRHAITNNTPVKISTLFGGNKLWRFDEAPEIDWAELFAVLYYLKWMKSIASVYEPGAVFDFYSQDVSVESLNNVPRSETDHYQQTFRAMLAWLKPSIPEGVQVTYRRHAEEYNNLSEYTAELEDAKKVILANNNGELPELSEAQKAATELNVRLKPGQADDPLWREKVELEHQAIFATKTLLPYLTDTTTIPTSPTPFPGLIAVGSTKRSLAKFWAGVGALEHSGEDYNELVLSPKQLQQANFDWEPVRLGGLEGKNFKKIRIIKQ